MIFAFSVWLAMLQTTTPRINESQMTLLNSMGFFETDKDEKSKVF